MVDIQTYLNNTWAAKRKEEMKTSPQLTVIELVLKLGTIEDSLPVYFDDTDYRPRSLGSWRGDYNELSVNYKLTEWGDEEWSILPENVKVRDLLEVLRSAIGKEMTGYKGGEFLMGKNTPVWVSCYGQSGGYIDDDWRVQAIVDVFVDDGKVILETKVIKEEIEE